MADPAPPAVQAPEETRPLARGGCTPEQIGRLAACRTRHRQRLASAQRRLDFARWLVRSGRLDEDPRSCRPPAGAAPRPRLLRALVAAVFHHRRYVARPGPASDADAGAP